jgi:NAD(P)-dependent dehydrogenase (short-subunit alcohol dehydrogenase family)
MTVGNTCEIADKEVCEEAYNMVRNHQSVGLVSNVLTFPSAKKYVQRLLAEAPEARQALQRRLAVVASPNKSSVGYFVAEELAAALLMDIVLVGGSLPQLEESAKSIHDEFKRRYPTVTHLPNIHKVKLDTNSLRSVKEAGSKIERIANKFYHGQVHVLVNMSGEVSECYSQTEEGVEVNMGRNYLAPRLLADLLLPLLRAAATDKYKPRLIQEASVGHCLGTNFDPFLLQKCPKKGGSLEGAIVKNDETGELEYSSPTTGMDMFYLSKMALMADTLGLANEEPMLAVVSCDPGIVSYDAKPLSSRVLELSPSQAARSALRAALDPAFNTTDMHYLHSDGNPWRISENANLNCGLEEYAEIVRCVGDELSGQLLADKDREWELWSTDESSGSLLSPSASPSVSPVSASSNRLSQSAKEQLISAVVEPPLASAPSPLRSSIVQASSHMWHRSFNSLLSQ